MITPDLLRAATGSSRANADLYAPHLAEACAAYGITTPQALAAFLAQLAHESGSLRYVRELADGSDYEGRVDLGNTEPGDGRRFLGRGLIQLTGRSNARAFGDAMRQLHAVVPDFEMDPAALEHPRWACWSAAWFWHRAGLTALADGSGMGYIKIGRAINRGNANSTKPANGEADRLARWEMARAALATYAPGDAQTAASAPPDAPQPYPDTVPAGEAPAWPPHAPKGNAMSTFSDIVNSPATRVLLGLVNPLLAAVPEVARIFMDKDGTTVPERNVALAVKIAEVAQQSLQDAGKPAANMQEVVETIAADPQAKAIVRAAVIDQCMSLVEAGGGGIQGARQANAVYLQPGAAGFWFNPSFWISAVLLSFVLMLLVDVFYVHPESYVGELRTQIVTGLLMIIGMVGGYWIGTSISSARKDEVAAARP